MGGLQNTETRGEHYCRSNRAWLADELAGELASRDGDGKYGVHVISSATATIPRHTQIIAI